MSDAELRIASRPKPASLCKDLVFLQTIERQLYLGAKRPEALGAENKALFEILKSGGDPFQIWLHLEEQGNSNDLRQSTAEVPMDLVWLDRSEVIVDASAQIPISVLNAFLPGNGVLWPRHPFNQSTDPLIPFQDRPAAVRRPMRLTASRSLVDVEGAFSVKLATDHNSPDRIVHDRIDLREEGWEQRQISEYLDAQTLKVGADPEFSWLREVLWIFDKRTRNGFVVRDLRPLRNGNLFLPGFSVPFLGAALAQANHEPFVKFWTRVMAEPLGKFIARALVKYGLALGSFHPQQFKIEFDRNLRPANRIVFLDIGEWWPIDAIADVIRSRVIKKSSRRRLDFFFPSLEQLYLYPGSEFKKLLPKDIIEAFHSATVVAYFREVERLLGVELEIGQTTRYYTIPAVDAVGRFIHSPKGRAALEKFHHGERALR